MKTMQRYGSYRPGRKVYANAETECARKVRRRLQQIRIESEREEHVHVLEAMPVEPPSPEIIRARAHYGRRLHWKGTAAA